VSVRDWDTEVLPAARAYGYTGPDTPESDADRIGMAEALRQAVDAAGGPSPATGTGPVAWIGAVVQGEVPLP
jgi:hypothetical protein